MGCSPKPRLWRWLAEFRLLLTVSGGTAEHVVESPLNTRVPAASLSVLFALRRHEVPLIRMQRISLAETYHCSAVGTLLDADPCVLYFPFTRRLSQYLPSASGCLSGSSELSAGPGATSSSSRVDSTAVSESSATEGAAGDEALELPNGSELASTARRSEWLRGLRGSGSLCEAWSSGEVERELGV